jgi:hypothetical protein
VNHINLDGRGEPIKRFFLSMPVDPEGAVVKLNGQALACVVPIAAGGNGHTDQQEWTSARNDRRCQLIDRKYERGLSPAEEAELAALQAAMYREVDRVAPLALDETRKLHQRRCFISAAMVRTTGPRVLPAAPMASEVCSRCRPCQ